MLPIYLINQVPLGAFDQSMEHTAFYPAAVMTTQIKASRHRSGVSSYQGPLLSSSPSDREITLSHAFVEPLIPVGSKTSAAENKALGSAIKTFLARKSDEDLSALSNFVDSHPDSGWRPTLDLNMAEIDYRTGNFSSALGAWQDAWDRTKGLTDAAGKNVGDLAVAKLAKMKARVGRMDELDALFKETKGRSVGGSAAELLFEARSGLWLMQKHPEKAFRCGPSALQELSLATRHRVEHSELIQESRSTTKGVALSDVADLAGKIGLSLQIAKRSAGAPFIVPAVLHWKLNHYAALTAKRDGRYEIRDTTFGADRFLVSPQTLENETSGYYLVPKGPLPHGWAVVGQAEAKIVFGRGNTGNSNPGALGPGNPSSDGSSGGTGDGNGSGGTPGGDCGSSGNNAGGDGNWAGGDPSDYSQDDSVAMTEASVKAMLVSLTLTDTPVRYTPPIGPAMRFRVRFNQRDNTQPSTFTYSNLGPGWTFSYLSYITPGASTSTLYERGGGVETFSYNSSTSSWTPEQMTQEVLSQVNSTTWQVAFANGEVETYGQPDGSGRFFLTMITDPQGNSLTLSYDANFRLTSLTDALGQITHVTYVSNTSSNLPAFYEIAAVTDPFSRSAQFSYNSVGELQQITDLIGITSSFAYASNNFINSLTTPYGLTKFSFGDITTVDSLGTTRWLEVTYPDGNKTRTEYNENQVPGGVSSGADTAGVPTGMYPGIMVYNNYMQYRDTYFWDKEAMKDHAGDYTQAKVTHWLHTSDPNTTSGIEESHKSVDQNRIWFGYTGEESSIEASDTMIAEPTQTGRIMDDGSTQLFTSTYNVLGKVTQKIDPLGRETDYGYAANDIDLLTVKQKNGSGYDLLATYTYNSQHEVLTFTDASGQTTTNVYYSNGELHTTTNPKSQTTTYTYNSSSYLTSVTGPVSGAMTSFTYDGFGRVRTVTDSQGYTTTTNYDAMDRPTLVTYPDSTTSQMNYSNLDLQYSKDRLGRWTHTFYNSLRQPIAVMDALGHVTHSNWTLSAGLQSLIDANGNVTTWKHDNQNRITEKDYSDGTSQKIGYENTTSRVKTVTDAKGQIATCSYNQDNTVQQTVYTNVAVATPTVSYTYDSIYPRMHTMGDGTGTTTYTYNAVSGTIGSNMLGSLQTPLTTIAFTYDQLGRQLSQTVGGISSNVTYDTLGRVSTATNALSSTPFTYSYLNNTGRLSSVAFPNGQSTAYTYQDSTGSGEPRLSEIKNLNASSGVISKFDYGYDSQGQITSWTQQTDSNDPQNWAIQYDNGGRLIATNVTDTTTSTLLHQYAYSYDAAGNRTAEQIDGNVTSAAFNNLNQLTGIGAGGKMVFSGTISKYATVTVAGNPASLDVNNNFRGSASVITGTNNVPIIAQDVDGNASTNKYQVVVPPGGSTSYSYDLNGNLTQDSTRSYQWDAKNELTAILYNSGANSGNHTEFAYNGVGERVKIAELTGTTVGSGTVISTKQYVWTGGLAEERDGTNTVTKRYFGQGEQRIVSGTPTNYFYTRDHLGSIREMIASNGSTVSVRYSYDPYGRSTQVSGSISCDFQYAGMYEHATSGLNLTKYRAYDPNVGRWISRDPSGEISGINLYLYCDDNPLGKVDREGLDPFAGVIVGAITGGIGGFFGSWAQGGSLKDALISAGAGAAVGGFVGFFDPTGGIVSGGIAGGLGDLAGQELTNILEGKSSPVDWNSVAANALGGALGAGVGGLAADALEDAGAGEITSGLVQGLLGFPFSTMLPVMSNDLGQLSNALGNPGEKGGNCNDSPPREPPSSNGNLTPDGRRM